MPQRIFGREELELLKEVLESGKLSSLAGGEMTPRFEREFAAALGAKYGVAMNSAMSVLHSCVKTAGAGAGHEVICDPVFVFGAMATMYNNAIPVFVDVDPVTHNMNPDLIEAKVTERTKAIIVTHAWGLPAPMDRINAIARKHNLMVIEDCAHSLFATYKGKYTGTWGDIGSFSFQMSKQLALGDGGMAVTDSEKLRDELALNAGAPTFQSIAYDLHFNYRMTEATAAIGIVQLKRAREYIAGIQKVAALYDEAVKDCEWITLQRAGEEAVHTFHLWAATFWGDKKGIRLEEFKQVLQEKGCSLGIGYTNMPAYKHPVIANRLGYPKGCPLDCPLYRGTYNQYPDGLCPVAEEIIPRILTVGTMGDDNWHRQNAEKLHEVIEVLS